MNIGERDSLTGATGRDFSIDYVRQPLVLDLSLAGRATSSITMRLYTSDKYSAIPCFLL